MDEPDIRRAIAATSSAQSRRTALSFSSCALLLLAAACSSATSGAPPPPDAAAPAPTPDAAVALPADFLLRNETGRTIYLQKYRHFELVRDGKVLHVVPGCCGHLECGQSIQLTIELAPAAEYAWSWDGRAMADECAPAEAVPAGPLAVRARYSFTRDGDESFSTVGVTMSVDRPFDHPPPTPVLVVVP